MATTSLWQTAPRGLFQYDTTGALRLVSRRASRRWVFSNRIGGCLTRRFLAAEEGLASTPSDVSGEVRSADSNLPEGQRGRGGQGRQGGRGEIGLRVLNAASRCDARNTTGRRPCREAIPAACGVRST